MAEKEIRFFNNSDIAGLIFGSCLITIAGVYKLAKNLIKGPTHNMRSKDPSKEFGNKEELEVFNILENHFENKVFTRWKR